MPAPTVIEPIVQKSISDCAIAALAMLLCRPYHDVSARAIRMTRKPHHRGLGTRQFMALARQCGAQLVRARGAVDLEDETGLLCVAFPDKTEHALVLFNGVIYNPADGLLYVPDVYVSSRKARVTGLWRVV